MKIRNLPIILLFIVAGFTHPLAAKPADGDSNTIAAPILFYTPETSLAMGIAGTTALRLGDGTHPSTISAAGYFTLNRQLVLNLKTDIFFPDNRIVMQNFLEYRNYPEKFYGIGNQTLPSQEEIFEHKSLEFTHYSRYRILSHLYLGPVFRFQQWNVFDLATGRQENSETLYGTERGTVYGIGFITTFDSRNRIFTPRRGYFLNLQALFYHRRWGSDYTYSNLKVDLRKYLPAFPGQVLVLRMYLEGNTGETPFFSLPKLGGSRLMRGIYMGRYRDTSLYVLQAEYRFRIFWRLGLAIFGALGDVVPGPGNLLARNLKYSMGVGIRYTFNREKGMTLRLDQGFTPSGGSTYLEAFEAF